MKRRPNKRERRDLVRQPPGRMLDGRTFLIVTEGSKTEPAYLKLLCSRLKIQAARVEVVHPEGTDPETLTVKAIQIRDERIRRAKTSRDLPPFDEVWVVFDLEEPNHERRSSARQAIAYGRSKGLHFGVSDPAFEFWLLLHEQYTHAPMMGCDDVVRRYKVFCPEYSKASPVSASLIEKTPTAALNAKKCRQHHEVGAGDGNPSTDIDCLVYVLNLESKVGFDLPDPEHAC